MTLNLGTISASVTLDLGGLTRGAAQAQSIFDRLGAGGSKGLDAVEQAANRAGSALKSLGAAKVTVDTGGAVGELRNVESAVQGAASSINGLGNESITIDTGGAVSELQGIQTAVQGTESSLSTLSNTHISVDTAGAVGELHSVETAVQGVEATIGTVSGTPLTISTGAAVGDLQSVETAVQAVEASVGAVSGTPLTISTTGTVGDLQSVETAVTGVASSVGAVSGTPLTIDTSGANSNLDSLSQKVVALGATLAAAGAGLAAFGSSFGQSMGLESALANVNSIARVSDKELDSLKGTILDLSVQLGASPTGLADGLYDIVSSGFAAQDAMTVLAAAAVAAKAGLTDTSVAARAITSVLNAYGKSAKEAGNVSDVLFQIVNSGVITFEQLANNMGSVLPVASVLKVSIQELGAAYAQLTLKGVNASAAETGIAALMRSAIQPTVAMSAALKDYGFASGEALIKSQGLAGYLTFLGEASGGTAAGMSKLLGNVEATNAALSLSANGGAGFTAMLQDMNGAAQNGATTLGVFAIQSATTQAALDRLGSSFGKFQIAMGDALSGPISAAANVIAGLMNWISKLPGPIQEVIGVLITLGGAIVVAGGALTLLGPGVATIATAIGGLLVVLGPVAIGIAAIGAAIGVGAYLWQRHTADVRAAQAAYEAYGKAVETVDKAIASEKLNGSDAMAKRMEDTARSIRDSAAKGVSAAQEVIEKSKLDWSKLIDSDSSDFRADITKFLSDGVGQAAIDFAKDSGSISQEVYDSLTKGLYENVPEAANQVQDIMKTYWAALTPTDADAAKIEGDISKIFELMSNPKIDQSALTSGVQKIYAELAKTGDVTAADAAFNTLFTTLEDGAKSSNNSADAVENLTEKLKEAQHITEVASKASAELYRTSSGAYREQSLNDIIKERARLYTELGQATANGETDRAEELTGKLKDTNDQYDELIAAHQKLFDATGMDGAVKSLTAMNEAATKANAAYGEMIVTGLQWQGVEENLGKINMAGAGTQYTQLAQNVMQANTALQSGFQVIVGNTNAIAQNAQGVSDWADKLIGAAGTYAEIDDLLANGVITLDTYNKAQEAGTTIFAANASIQQDILGIQAQQAPVLAELTAQQAEYVHQLAGIDDSKLQLIALGWMDASEAAKANQIITTAAAAAQGDLGESGRIATEKMIVGAAQADPVLKAMLQDMKLINVGADGTITVNFDSAKNAHSEIAELTKSIDALTVALGGVPPVHVDVEGADAKKTVDGILGTLTGLDGKTAKPKVDATGATTASDAIGSVLGDLTGLDGKTATPTVAVTDNASKPIADTKAAIDSLPDSKTVTINVAMAGANALSSAQSAAGAALGGIANAIEIPAKVGPVDTSAIDNIADKSITVTADVSQAVIGVYNLTTQIDGIADKTATVTVNVATNDPTGLLGGGGNPTGAPMMASNEMTRTLTVDVVAHDPEGYLGSQTGGITRTLTVNVVANDPQSLISHAYDSGAGGALTGLSRTLTVNVVANDPQSLISHAYDAGAGGVLTGLTRTLTVNVVANDPQGLLGSQTGVVGLPNTGGLMAGDMTRTITVNAVDNTATILAAVATAVTAIPTAHTTSISESGSAVVVGMATSAKTAVEAIPTAWATSITESGGAIVTGSANDANAAISDIPTSWSTQFSESGSGNVIGAANGIANAVNNVPSGKTISFNIVTTGSIPRLATGGIIPAETTVARLAERGPELFRNPSGSYGMAMTDSLYPMTPGARVFTAAQTKRMLSTWDGPAYARGGVVGGSNVNTDLLDIARNLAAYGGDYTPKPIVDVLVQIRELGKVGGATTQQLKIFSDQLKAFNADNTPKAIVDQALRLDKIASSLQTGSSPTRDSIRAEDGSYVNPSFYSNNSSLFNQWKKLFSAGQTSSNWTQYKARGYAKGGTVRSDTARMGELGPELLRYPSGKNGMALTDGLYSVPIGTYVYTASKTSRMLPGVRGYASGGYVRRQPLALPTRASQNGGTTVIDNSSVSAPVNIQVHPRSTLDPNEERTLYTNVARAVTSAVDTVRTAKGVRE